MAKASDNLFPYLHLVPAAAPAAPAAGSQRLYLDSGNGNRLTRKDSAGAVTVVEGGGSSGGLLASVAYNPATSGGVLVNLGSSDSDIDATNLAITFTVPTSGIVIAKWSAYVVVAPPTSTGSTAIFGTWREGAATVPGGRSKLILIGATTAGPTWQGRLTHSARISGLTPGASKTWKAGAFHAIGTGGSPSGRIGYGDDGTAGGFFGPAVLEVYTA